jgi:ABC-2 type transport system ATP-binding protein
LVGLGDLPQTSLNLPGSGVDNGTVKRSCDRLIRQRKRSMIERIRPPASPGSALELSGISKRFRTSWGKRVEVLRQVGFSVAQGSVYGLLGPNGAGKSTTLKIVLGLMKPSGGEGRALGEPLGSVAARKRIGFLPENPYFYDYLSAREFLDTCASLTGLPRGHRRPRIDATLERVGLDPGSRLRLRKYSKGMLQRIGLAQAILHDPDLLILDEPMSGLDPIGRRQVRDLILDLKREGKTILFSSHILSDVEALCERVGILVKGELRREGRVADLLGESESRYEIETRNVPATLLRQWKEQGCIRESGDRILLMVQDPEELGARVQQVLHSGATLLAVKPVHRSLEDVFLHLAETSPSSTSMGPFVGREAA